MSLVKQLWLAIVVVMAIAFGGSLIVNVLSARAYLQQQLQIKNIDNATSLALALTQLDKDPITVELLVSAQFDAGHYRFIRIIAPTGETLVERVFEGEVVGAPRWFTQLIPLEAEPGRAQVQDGWRQFGTVMLASNEQFAYKNLWQGTLDLLLGLCWVPSSLACLAAMRCASSRGRWARWCNRQTPFRNGASSPCPSRARRSCAPSAAP